MGIGPRNDPAGLNDRGVAGIGNLILFGILGWIGTALGAFKATAVAMLAAIEHEVLEADPNTPLDAGTAAVAVVKGVIPEGEGASEVRLNGLSSERFDVLVKATGNAPGWVDLLDQWRRGLIGTGELEHGIRTGLLRDEWIPFVQNLRHIPLSAAQYLNAAVRGHMSEGEAVAKADGLGLNTADATLLFETLGSPPSPGEVNTLLNRGIIDEGAARLAIQEGDIKPKYTNDILALRVYLPPPRTVTALLRNGSISQSKARELFIKHGLPADLADAYVADASHGRTASHKQVAVGTVKSLYVDHLVDRPTAEAWLTRIGYGADDASLILDLAEFESKQKLRTQAINRVRALYTGKHIDEATARADLGHLGVEMGQIADLLAVWQVELVTPSKELTLAQLTALAKANVIDQSTWLARIEALGYSPADAALLALLDFPAPAGG